ncbi:hypothetical protein Bca52824_048591 [Brassica carinata]|uniref:Uncharacterized protein n=1 Tax=Brassica carinata TaxID=52824 RepID=A0A8X7RJF4_BRACI|nr:hypothetical protein Bca52824_048591 [Brassica carinata]
MYAEGLDLMKRAADAGFERASYTYAMTRKLWDDDGDHFRGFSRDYVAKIGLLLSLFSSIGGTLGIMGHRQ